MLKEKQKAPDFALEDKDSNIIRLSDFIGKKVVIYFYPKDNTTGCTKQACSFSNLYNKFKEKDIVLIGISKDSKKSHKSFIEKYNLPFILLSDQETKVMQDYDVWKEKKMYGKTYMGTVRTTYIIDENGFIEKAMDKVNPEKNALDILNYIG